MLNEAASRLQALGRLTEAVEPMRICLDMLVARHEWKGSAISASNLSNLDLTLGNVSAAGHDAEQSVAHADRSGDAFWRMASRTTLADALHQAGRHTDTLARFREAEVLQAERQPQYSLLYSLQGFRYCDLLLAEAERAAARVPLFSGHGGEGRGERDGDATASQARAHPHPIPLPRAGEGSAAALKEARRLIEETGYHRRDEELQDAEEAAANWPDAPGAKP